MNKNKEIKHSVIIITYNQQDLIRRALDSLLCQKEDIYEIIIADDCSIDSTWEVIQGCQELYPDLIKPYSNAKNLGIFGNIESTWDKPTGDIIWYLSGDDIYCDGLFKEANKLIEKKGIDYRNDAFTLYFDYKTINPQGKEKVYSNKLVENYNPISLKIRQLICNRTTGVSHKVFENYYPVRKDIGIFADGLIDIQVQLLSDNSYYSPFVGSAYYTSIGISSATKIEDSLKSYILSIDQLKIDIKNISKSDLAWLKYLQIQLSFNLTPNFSNFIKYFKNYIVIIRQYYGFNFLLRETKNIFRDLLVKIIHR